VALAVVAAGLAAWIFRKQLVILTEILQDFGDFARNSFGFEAINTWIVNGVQGFAEELRNFQTGILNLNVLAILVALIVVLLFVSLGA